MSKNAHYKSDEYFDEEQYDWDADEQDQYVEYDDEGREIVYEDDMEPDVIDE